MIYWELFWSFVKVGLFCVGGGYASMPLIQAEVIDNHAWMTMAQFIDIFTISQMTPGPIGRHQCSDICWYEGRRSTGGRGGDGGLCFSVDFHCADFSEAVLQIWRYRSDSWYFERSSPCCCCAYLLCRHELCAAGLVEYRNAA